MSTESDPKRSRSTRPDTVSTAAVVVIGNEILSGRTQDINLTYMAKGLAGHGIRLSEARIIPDIESVIVDTINALRSTNSYVFTTGGIGPTHDDITADCIAKAFGVDIDIHPESEKRLLAYWKERDIQPNSDRLRMARIPHGAHLIDNPVSAAPGFQLENVYVMAGVPRIMQAMFDSILPLLQAGAVIESVSVSCNLGEGTIASPLRALQERFPDVDLGSYPGEVDGKFRVTLVGRSADKAQLKKIDLQLRQLIKNAGGELLE